jgi:hypothetical protein
VLGQPLPEYDAVEIQDSNLSELVPTEVRADLVLLLHDRAPVFSIAVEAQLGRDPDKRYSWPLYAATLRAKFRCPSCVLVVTPDRAVADWARMPIDTGQPRSPFVPLVLGPNAVPRITDVEEAREAPEHAMLSALAHCNEPGGHHIAFAALAAASHLDDEASVVYFDLIRSAVGEAARRSLEELMEKGTYEFQSDFARKYLAKGEAKGRAEGEAKGRAEGEAKGRAEAVLRVLEARGVNVADEGRERILSCTDLALLDRWLSRAAVAESAHDVFGDDDQ